MGAVILPGFLTGKVLTSKYNLFFLDLVHKSETNETQVLSDMQLVALDVYAEFREWLMDNAAELADQATFTDLNEYGDDEVTGWSIEITINQFFSRSTCELPN